MLQKAHEGHSGESKSSERTKSAMYLPGYVEQVRKLVAGCNTCQESRQQNLTAQFHPIHVPVYPFQRVACDLFHLLGKDYLLVVDNNKKCPSVVLLNTLSSQSTILELDKLFADSWVPDVLISDIGAQLGSNEFQDFAWKLQLKHCTTSPYYPQANGLAAGQCKQWGQRSSRPYTTASQSKTQSEHSVPLPLLAGCLLHQCYYNQET